jgi:hypothetical protein
MRLEVNSIPAVVLERFGKEIGPLFSLIGNITMKIPTSENPDLPFAEINQRGD